MDDEKLIVLVQKYPELYDNSDDNYMNSIRRMNCWEEIASNMNGSTDGHTRSITCLPAEECKKRWTQIRENYRRAKVRIDKTTTGQAATKRKPLKFEKELSFLNNSVSEQRRQISNVNNPIMSDTTTEEEPNNETESNILDISTEDTNLTATHSTAPVVPVLSPASTVSPLLSPASQSPSPVADTNTPKPPSRYGRKAQKSPISEYFKYKKELQESKLCSKTTPATTGKNDHLSKFFQAMEESVRGFPPYLQVEAKTRISTIVLELEGQAVQINHPIQPQYYNYQQFPGYNQQVSPPGQFSGGYQQAGNTYYNPVPSSQHNIPTSNHNFGRQNENYTLDVNAPENICYQDLTPGVVKNTAKPSGV